MMNHSSWGYVGAYYPVYDHGAPAHHIYMNSDTERNQTPNRFDTQGDRQFGYGEYNQHGYSVLQNQNPFLSSNNYHQEGRRTYDQFGTIGTNHANSEGSWSNQFGHYGIRSQWGDHSSNNWPPEGKRTYDHNQFGHYGLPHGNSEGIRSQWGHHSSNNWPREGRRTYDDNHFGHYGLPHGNSEGIRSQWGHHSSNNWPPEGRRTYDDNHFGHYGLPHGNSEGIRSQWIHHSSNNWHPEEKRTNDHHQSGHYGLPHGNSERIRSQWGHESSNQHQYLEYEKSFIVDNNASNRQLYDRQTKHLLRTEENRSLNTVSVDTHREDRHHLVNYLKYLPMPADEIGDCDISTISSTDGVHQSDISMSISSDINMNQATEIDVNVSFEQGAVHEENDRNVTESVITKPKYKVGCDNSAMFVKPSNSESPKKLCCPFCEKLYLKLARHLEVKHKTEPDVQKILSYPKGSKQRRLIQDSLRKVGMTNWNKNAKLNKNEMITCRRPNKNFSNDGPRFKMCPYCHGFYAKSSLRLHVKYKCPQKPPVDEEKTKGQRVITALSTSIESRHLTSASLALQKVYKTLRDDALVRSLKFDWLITVYGNKLAARNTKLRSPDMIKGRLRLIARFLHELKRIEPDVTDLATMYHPKYFDCAVEAIQAVARLNVDTNVYGAPATASSCVTAIKQIGVMLIAEYIKRDDSERQRLTQNFMTVMSTDIHYMINKTVNENQSKMRRRKVINLPSLDDLKMLNEFIESESNNCYQELSMSKSFDYEKWVYLSQLTMISILLFNRKRVGDTENITVDDFACRESMNENANEQLFASLSDESKEVAKRYTRMKVRGKKNRTVPVLLNRSMEKSLDLIIAHREDARISPKNEYLFALRPSAIEDIKVISAGIALRKFVKLSGVKNPSSVTGTYLRKQLATMCVSMKLDDTEVADVADFMGHAELVHRNNYRQNTIDRQVVKMSQWLEAALGKMALIDTERAVDTKNTRATELLELLLAALDKEDGLDDKNDVRPPSDASIESAVAREGLPAARKSLPADQESQTAARESLPAARESLPAARESVPAVQESLPAVRKRLPTDQKRQRAALKSVPAARKNLPSNRKRSMKTATAE